jgi:hypothetical protein
VIGLYRAKREGNLVTSDCVFHANGSCLYSLHVPNLQLPDWGFHVALYPPLTL